MEKVVFVFAVCTLLLLAGCAGQQSPPVNGTNGTNVTPANQTPVVPAGPALVAEKGDTVAVDYVGYLDTGEVFDTSIKAEAEKAGLGLRSSYAPLTFKVGAGEMIAGFDAGVVGMKVGEEKTIHVLPADAYGERIKEFVISVPRAHVQGDVQVGSQLIDDEGKASIVVALDNETVTLDYNHPLAGKALNFKIIMRNITKATNTTG